MTDRTKWFPPEIKPKRRGVYRTKYSCDAEGWSYWTGRQWLYTFNSHEDAHNSRLTAKMDGTTCQNKNWCGLVRAASIAEGAG